MSERQSIRILKGALDEIDLEGKGKKLVLRGVIDPDSFEHLLTPEYQRGVLTAKKIEGIVEAFRNGRGEVPDVDLGMRGDKWMERDEVIYLQDPTFIIDGLQRVTSGIHAMRLPEGQAFRPHLGALVHLNTTEEWERERFKILNTQRTKVSVNVILRNLRHQYSILDLLTKVCEDRSFVLCQRVSWGQSMRRNELLTAMLFLRTIGALHAHLGPARQGAPEELSVGIQRIMDKIGKNVFRDNVKTFFDLIDQCWNLRSIALKDVTPWIKGTFMDAFASVLSMHKIFWRDNRLTVERSLLFKIKAFPVQDPNIVTLSSAGGTARSMLMRLIIEHINSGKRSRRLIARDNADIGDEPDNSGEGEGEEPQKV